MECESPPDCFLNLLESGEVAEVFKVCAFKNFFN